MDEVQSVPLAAYESMSTRLCRIIRWILTGWALSMVAMGLVIVISLSYGEEVMTETTEVAQEADDNGYNTFNGGDYYDGTSNGQDNAKNSQTYARSGNVCTETQNAL